MADGLRARFERGVITTPAEEQQVFRCRACSDQGLIVLNGHRFPTGSSVKGVSVAEIIAAIGKSLIPCTCQAGDIWRAEHARVSTPPPCADCGRPSHEYTSGEMPRCLPCSRIAVARWRKTLT